MKDCINCKHRECWEYAYPCNSCTDIDPTGKPTNWEAQTRADRVRAMTDEELAEWLDNNTYRFQIYKDWLDWLKQEVSDG